MKWGSIALGAGIGLGNQGLRKLINPVRFP